jgi:serpin B
VLLPKQTSGLANLEKAISVESFDKSRASAETYAVTLSLPRFKYTSDFSLKKVLISMGMDTAFSDAADFSGMTTRDRLRIAAVFHKAFIAADEKGSEAAAATAVVVGKGGGKKTALPRATFRADHPFLFLIRENRTGGILFMGRVTNPKA